jgi:hypothetical protein
MLPNDPNDAFKRSGFICLNIAAPKYGKNAEYLKMLHFKQSII